MSTQTVAPWAVPPPVRAPQQPSSSQSSQPQRGRLIQRPWVTAVLTGLSFLFGPLVMVLVYIIAAESQALSGEMGFFGPGRPVGLMIALDLLLGLLAVALVPVVLRHAPRQEDLEVDGVDAVDASRFVDREEPRSALIAGLLLCVIAGAASSAGVAAVIAMITLCSRGRWLWVGLVYGTAVISGLLGNWVVAGYGNTPGLPFWVELPVFTGTLAVMMLVPALIGMYRWSRRRRIRALQAEALTARREAAALVREEHARAEQSRAQERPRIAREMHDTLSHRLALISTYAGALDYREDLDRDTVRSTARLVQQTAATASAELRTVLDVLRDDDRDTRPEPDLREVPQLLEEFRAAGARIDVVGEDAVVAEDLPDTTARTLYRILQEALTNAVKHAPGAPISVRWSRQPQAVCLSVSNPLVDGAHPVPSGFGLVGLDERARGLGGTISTERTETAFRLEARIPCRS